VRHEELEPIMLHPVKESNGEVVYKQLEEAVEKTGIPREIVGDEGSDLKAGIRRFCAKHKKTDFIYDIKHKVAVVLKRELSEDEDWKRFWSERGVRGKKYNKRCWQRLPVLTNERRRAI
jgi:hypothetical protein